MYVIPLEAGMCTKPDFLELLEYCTISDPSPDRMLSLILVIGSDKTRQSSPATAL
jgi:hypothetical protein